MDIKVRVLAKRGCFASIEYGDPENPDLDIYLLSFGNLKKPDTDVEVEFSPAQLKKLRNLLNELYEEDEFTRIHAGCC